MTEPKNEPVRIVLPARTSIPPVCLVPPKITPLPAASEFRSAGPAQDRPKNETARISTLMSPIHAIDGLPPALGITTSSALGGLDAIPPAFRWILFGSASVNFLIQIWIYVVS